MSDFLPKLSYTSRDFNRIRDELYTFIKTTRPDAWSDFAESNLGSAMVECFALVGDMLSFGQDAAALEMFLSTCKRYESALRFAKSVGYRPRSAAAASVTVKSAAFPTDLTTNGGTILKGASLSGLNGQRYELLNDFVINAGDSVARVELVEGYSLNDTFSPSNKQNQEVQTQGYVVQDGSWQVYVGDTSNPNNLWAEVDNVQFENGPTKTYDTYFDGQGRLTIRFGDGDAGLVPNAAITVFYRTTSGAAGNSPVSSIVGSMSIVLNVTNVVVTVQFENKDVDSNVTSSQTLVAAENLGLTVASATQGGIALNFPIVSGSFGVVLQLPGTSGTIIFQDDGAGSLEIVSNTTTIQLVSSHITYSTGEWGFVLDTSIAANGVMVGNYYWFEQTSLLNIAILGAASGGADRETLAELKNNIPAYIRSQDKVIALQDYDTVISKLPGIALVFTDIWVSSCTANLVKINMWASETISFKSESPDGTFAVSSYTRYKELTHDRVDEVQAYLRPRSMLSIHNTCFRPPMLWVDVYLGDVSYDKRYAAAEVRQAITDAVVSVFQNGTGFEVRQSQIYENVREATGVLFFELERLATGTQAYSTELQGLTSNTTSISGQLVKPVCSPGSVQLSIEQSALNTIVLKDDKAGGFVLVSGIEVSLVSSAINYQTGVWSVTFLSALIPNQRILASYSDIANDYRHDQIVTVDTVSNTDPYPPSGLQTKNPPTPPYFDGKPLSPALPHSFVAGDQLTYADLQDIVVQAKPSSNNIYDETFSYNNEIYYDTVKDLVTDLRAINLRRLHFNLVPV